MAEVSVSLRDRISRGSLTLCHVFLIEQRNGTWQGFTDHDQSIVLMDIRCLPGAGLERSEIVTSLAQSPGTMEVLGTVQSPALVANELDQGILDGAMVTVFIVDWMAPNNFSLIFGGYISEVTRMGQRFQASVKGPAQALNRTNIRRFQRTCDVKLGSTQCQVDLENPRYRAELTVLGVLNTTTLRVAISNQFAAHWFTRGTLQWSSGGNTGFRVEIETHQDIDDQLVLKISPASPRPIRVRDQAIVYAGCDKTAHVCRTRFLNLSNFRGFPHIPGNRAVFSPSVADND